MILIPQRKCKETKWEPGGLPGCASGLILNEFSDKGMRNTNSDNKNIEHHTSR
jgi:hypothetical protein